MYQSAMYVINMATHTKSAHICRRSLNAEIMYASCKVMSTSAGSNKT